MSRELFDRLREIIPALTDMGKNYDPYQNADMHGIATFGPNSLRAIITALTPCACGAVAGQDCAPDCDMDDIPPAHNIASSPYVADEFQRDASGRWIDPLGAYGYSARFSGTWVCYTDGHLCECGE